MVLNIFKRKKNKKPVAESPEIKEKPSIPKQKPVKKKSFFKRLKDSLSPSKKNISGGIDTIYSGNRKFDDQMLEEIEELLITSDIGVETSMSLIEQISKKSSKISNADDLKDIVKNKMLSFIKKESIDTIDDNMAKPHVIMVVGVNGVGKTTTIGKLASNFTLNGKKVLIAAADTFRAAAVEQLDIWAKRAGVDIVKHKENSDPAAVAFDGVQAAIARDVDIVLIDTAGRLQTQKNLMEELKKIHRSVGKKLNGAPHEVLMVVDATTGQNALSQTKLFNDAIGLTGIALTKLDGTAKGGMVIALGNAMDIPIKYIGIGEGIDDLQPFVPEEFVEALL